MSRNKSIPRGDITKLEAHKLEGKVVEYTHKNYTLGDIYKEDFEFCEHAGARAREMYDFTPNYPHRVYNAMARIERVWHLSQDEFGGDMPGYWYEALYYTAACGDPEMFTNNKKYLGSAYNNFIQLLRLPERMAKTSPCDWELHHKDNILDGYKDYLYLLDIDNEAREEESNQ